MSRGSDLVVIGGGLIGLSCALAARRRGLSVRLLEAERCARHASSASAGGVRSLNRHPAEIPLARAALPLWGRMREQVGDDCGFRVSGQLRVAEDETALAALERRRSRVRALGHEHETLLSARELRARVPALAGHCLGALAVEDDGFADPLASVHAYRRQARRSGVVLEEGVRVIGLGHEGAGLRLEHLGPNGHGTTRAGACVNAAGAWGGALARLAGETVPIRTAALQMIVTAPLPAFLAPVIGSEGRKLSLKQSAAGALVVGGGHEGRVVTGGHGSARGEVVAARVAENLANAVALFPRLVRARVVRTWTGLEGMLEDGLPVLGPSATLPGLVHAFGFSAHGFALVPLIGPLVADLVEGRAPTLSLEAFRPTRFQCPDARRREAAA